MIGALLPFALLGLFAIPVLLVVRALSNTALAALTVGIGGTVMVLLTFTVSSLLGLDPILFTLGVGFCAAVAAVVVMRARSIRVARPHPVTLVGAAGASLGGVVWFSALAIAQALHGSNAVNWAMRGDSANHIHHSRDIFAFHGFVLGNATNPVPLQNELLTMAAWFGRPDGPFGTQLEHDIVALAAVWSLAIAAVGFAIGVTAASLLPRTSAAMIGAASGTASLLATTWFFTGLPLDSGYYNVHVALPFALASWLVYLQSARRPVAATLLLLGCGVLLLTSWSPLVVLPVAFIAVIAIHNWSRVRLPRGRAILPIGVALVVFVGVLFIAYFPKLITGFSVFTSPGHGYPFTIAILLAGVFVLGVVLVVKRRQTERLVVHGVLALIVASALGIGLLVLIARDEPVPWLTYYPTKLTWLATVVIVVIALSAVFGLLGNLRRTGVASVVIAAVGVVSIAVAGLGPAPDRKVFTLTAPLAEVISGKTWSGSEETLDRITANLNRSDTVVLWNSGVPAEAMVNFWVLDFSGASARDGNEFARRLSVYGYRELRDTGRNSPLFTLEFLCELPDHLEKPVTIQTADDGLPAALQEICPGSELTVEPVSP